MQTSLPPVSQRRERHLRVRLAQDEHDRLAALAGRHRWTISEAVRRLLTAALSDREEARQDG